MPDLSGGQASSPAPAQQNAQLLQQGPLIVLALVFDSSELLGSLYPHTIANYLMPFIKRIVESNPGYRVCTSTFRPMRRATQPLQMKLGIVTYGPGDRYPTPIITNNFFQDTTQVFPSIRDQPEVLGIGTSNSNPESGMAALDGLVAALEVVYCPTIPVVCNLNRAPRCLKP